MLDDGHDFNVIGLHPVVDGVNPAHAAAVAFPDVIHSAKKHGVVAKNIKIARSDRHSSDPACASPQPDKAIPIKFAQVVAGRETDFKIIARHRLLAAP